VTLARNQHGVIRLGLAYRVRDGGRTTFDCDGVGIHAGHHVGNDGRRRFAARVVVGDDHAIGVSFDGAAHQRPLTPVAVAAAAEYAPELAAAVLPQCLQRRLNGSRRVRIVHEDARYRGSAARALHAPGRRADSGQCAGRVVERRPSRTEACDHETGVRHVEAARHWQEKLCRPVN